MDWNKPRTYANQTQEHRTFHCIHFKIICDNIAVKANGADSLKKCFQHELWRHTKCGLKRIRMVLRRPKDVTVNTPQVWAWWSYFVRRSRREWQSTWHKKPRSFPHSSCRGGTAEKNSPAVLRFSFLLLWLMPSKCVTQKEKSCFRFCRSPGLSVSSCFESHRRSGLRGKIIISCADDVWHALEIDQSFRYKHVADTLYPKWRAERYEDKKPLGGTSPETGGQGHLTPELVLLCGRPVTIAPYPTFKAAFVLS